MFSADEVPFRILLGSDAIPLVNKFDIPCKELHGWEKLSVSTDFTE